MKVIETVNEEITSKIDGKEFFGEGLVDSYLIEPDKFGDSRGYFSPYFIGKALNEKTNVPVFGEIVQCNRSMSKKGSLRGLHYQLDPKCQSKIVEVISGKAIDVITDIRKDSPTFGKWFGVLLTPENGRQLLVPKGFAHGFLALEDNTLFQYLVDNDYAPSMEAGIPWNDKSIGVDWKSMMDQYDITEEDLEFSKKDMEHTNLLNKLVNDQVKFMRYSEFDYDRLKNKDFNEKTMKSIEEVKKQLTDLREDYISLRNFLSNMTVNDVEINSNSKKMTLTLPEGEC